MRILNSYRGLTAEPLSELRRRTLRGRRPRPQTELPQFFSILDTIDWSPRRRALDQAIARGVTALRKAQAPDGDFTATVASSTVMMEAMALMTYSFLGRLDDQEVRVRRIADQMWAQQTATGGFARFEADSDHDQLSLLAYVAARVIGEPPSSTRMQKLRAVIESQDSTRRMSLTTRALLAPLGLASLPRLPSLQVVMAIDSLLPWAKVLLEPVIYLEKTGSWRPPPPHRIPWEIGLTASPPVPRPVRGETQFFEALLSRLNRNGTLMDYLPPTAIAMMALATRPEHGPVIERALDRLHELQEPTPHGLSARSSEAGVAETALSVTALLAAGVSPSDEGLSRARDFMLSRQVPTGGFCMPTQDEKFPDTDSTANVLPALHRLGVREPVNAGISWLLSLQNRDGGFPTYERETWISRRLREHVRLFLSESVVEHSARVMLCLSDHKEDPRVAQALRRATSWLRRQQRPDGSYEGQWFVNYVFGTANALAALGSNMEDPRTREAAHRAIAFIVDKQQEDGGFGESPESFDRGRYVAATSSPALTGGILSALLTFIAQGNEEYLPLLKPVFDRAARFLVNTQGEDGTWGDDAWIGVVFPALEYIRYGFAGETLPINALALYRKLCLPSAAKDGADTFS